jgi:hypothetical protein
MPLIAALAHLTVSTCVIIARQWIRLDYTGDYQCLVVEDSFFWNLSVSTVAGGAILVIQYEASFHVNVTDSTFIDCFADWGGAICFDCPLPSVERCCGTDCSATTGGHFVQLGGYSDPSWATVSLTTVFACAPPWHSGGWGAVNNDRERIVNCSSTNFTECKGNAGSAVDISINLSQCTCRYLTVAYCNGETGIDSQATVAPLIEFCNIYNNSLTKGSVFTARSTRQATALAREILTSSVTAVQWQCKKGDSIVQATKWRASRKNDCLTREKSS